MDSHRPSLTVRPAGYRAGQSGFASFLRQRDDAVAVLAGREREVFGEIAQGYANPEIARRLYLSDATVKTHVGRILAKLGLRDRVHIVVFACDHGLVRPA